MCFFVKLHFILCPQILPGSIQHFKQDDRSNVHVALHVSAFNVPGLNPSLQWWMRSFDTVTQQRHNISFISLARHWKTLVSSGFRSSSSGVLQLVRVKYVTKGTVAFHARCCASHGSMWSLEIAAVQCQCVYRGCLCDVPGAEPILDVSSTLHHAAPSKNKIPSSSQLSAFFFFTISSKHFPLWL